nr:1-deoxy-D-xylulose-5-phosphate synthase [Desulfobulbaceae bacterium]
MTYPSTFLDTINSPIDLRKLELDELNILAGELRSEIIKTVSSVGGHLAPCLGVVELTLAIHYVFNTPTDKLIWDVGHQCYAHKLITGRRDRFSTIRQHNGLSGFPKRDESPYDAFDTGHSSTSISAGLGMACGRDINGGDQKVISVIGDGSMTGGMAFEALNQAGHLGKDLIVILNDNEMSISPNVGALSSFLSRKMTGRTITKVRRETEHFLKSLSNVGENILQVLKKSEGSFKAFFTPGMLFEALRFDYIGPIPGHDLDSLIETFENVSKFSNGPTLIHVLTTKGKGYKPAEENPGDYHGVGPFDLSNGRPLSNGDSPPSYTKIFGKTICELAEKNERIVAISAAMPAGTGLTEFAERFPDRFFDVGIAEQHAVTFAAGLASENVHPVVAIYSTFLQRSLDQIIHDVCLQNLPVTFILDRGGLVGDDGPTHHGVFDLTFLRMIPNMVLMAPKDENELRHMIHTAISHPGPAAVRYPRGSGIGCKLDNRFESLEIGKGEVLREGTDILLIPVGGCVNPAIEAAEGLKKVGVDAAVINPRFISPLDEELIVHWSKKIGRVITIEENVKKGGFGSAVLETLASHSITSIQIKVLGLPDAFMEHATQSTLRRQAKIDSPSIIQAALEMVKK